MVEADAARRPGPAGRRATTTCGQLNPKLVFCTISGYGMTGPVPDLPAHGVAFDTWAGIVTPQVNEDGFAYLPEHASMGIHAGPLFGALGILAAVLRAKDDRRGLLPRDRPVRCRGGHGLVPVSETWKAYERPESEVTGNKADDYERREPGTAGMVEGVRYQVYEAQDGRYVLFMASEQAFWKNFCEFVGRIDLFERWPGSKYADHARNNLETAGRAARHLPHPHRRGVAGLREHGQLPGGPGQLAQDHRRGPPVPGPVLVVPGRAARCRAAGHPAQVRGRGATRPRPTPPRWASTPTRCCVTLLGWDDARIAESRARGGLGGGAT